MSNELIPQDAVEGGALSNASFDDVTTTSEFLVRVQLYGAKSNDVVEGKIPGGHYGIPTDNSIIDLGNSVDAALLVWRPKALAVKEDPIIESFDPESSTFQNIKNMSEVKDSGAMFGPEFLLYIPSVDKFCTFFMGSKTARREAKNMEPLLRQAITLKSKVIKQNNWVWNGPVVVPCTSVFDMPDMDKVKEKITQFLNPPKREVELADPDDSDRER